MFEGTVRTNLDHLEEHTDEHIWKALGKCQLGDEIRRKAEKLDSPVCENGENWSVGQRRLVCVGRVLMRKSKILVLDEATASVDTETDNLIQQTLKHHFSDSTVITIAHRITSVLDCDMVLLLDNGILKEYDSPERNGGSDEKILTLTDLGVKTLSWLSLYIFLQTHFSNSRETKYPLVLRLWWGFFFTISCYCLVADIVYFKKHHSLSILFWASDVVSVVVALILCCIAFSGKNKDGDTVLQEPLLLNESLKGEETTTPYEKAGVFSLLTFSWISCMISLGQKRTLNLEDLPQLAISDSVRGGFPILNDCLEASCGEINRVTTIMLVKGLVKTTRAEIAISAVCVFVYTLSSYVGPYLIDSLVQYLNGRGDFKNEGYALVSAFFVAKLLESFAQRHWVFKVQQAGNRARAALVAKVYNKGLTLSCQSKQGRTTGEIINLMSVDAERISDFAWYLHDPWMVVLQVVLALIILYRALGVASVAGVVATFLLMLVNFPLGKLEQRFQEGLMKSKDKRMKSTSEVLKNMRILKLQDWEMKFLSKIQDLRSVETGWLGKYLYTSAVSTLVFWIAPTFVSLLTFGSCVLMGVPLESGKILSALATLRILQEPIYNLPDAISMIVQTKVSLDRIASFLSLDDLQEDVVESLPFSSSAAAAVEVINGNFSWDASSPTLREINLRVSCGMRVAVCGTVGSGKSSLLACILGEMPKISGLIRLSGTKAYVAQSAWIQSGKIEENILFGKEMDRQWYNRVLEACCLNRDLEILAFGDQTVVGERGINLSGGQKQRIQIARALYQDADIYLFDDPFSAVDAHTGTHLFNECIMGLLDSKTVIYVTHQVEFLPAADLVLVMKNGEITQAGKYNDILKSGSDFMELVGAHEEALSSLESIDATTLPKPAMQKLEQGADDENDGVDNGGEAKGQLVQEEERERGNVGLSVYWKYITTAYSGVLAPVALLAQIMFLLLQIGSNYWMAWATPASKTVAPRVKGSILILVYVLLSVGAALCTFGRALTVVTIGYKTANILFNKMHLCIFRAPMSFFDSTPSGRVLSRASTDQSSVDLRVASIMGQFAFSILQVLGIIAVMSQVAWQVFIIFIPVFCICMWLQRYYIGAARELARLCGVSKAPVIQHFSETLSGAITIRSFDQESRFRDTSMRLIDAYSRPQFHSVAAMQWLCVRLQAVSLVTFASALIFLVSVPRGTIDAGIAGLAVTYGLTLNLMQTWVVQSLCYMENTVVSVERILQFTCIPSEPPLVVEANRPESSWPMQGEVSIQDLQVRYGPHMPFVLRGLTCTFFGGKRTGIVGRTGSGKSTLIQTLFRIVEPTIGHILIDGIDILSIGLHDLRSRLSIIPQDPTMFEGTVRTNLDPLEEHTDEQIWEALDKCQLGDEIRRKTEKLDSPVCENGENWSVGQRQLVCLGRVLLRRSKVLVLDEATASVDTATDNLIQQTLKHRLVKEYDSPEKLLEEKTSSFAALVAEYSMRSTTSSTL
ncbi:multidrug resistance-associated protein 3 [Perilla frutescens var. hirtella]|uniref:ABC-type xenobiotic transporter n=1 Tax=Perilla frutescens var. hirtella TaxID=608512 RepID=A0AAD4P1H5_PERFH|nr:multidrug resistance-associated protein 3 [Perilla frutescens var. hirtella]